MSNRAVVSSKIGSEIVLISPGTRLDNNNASDMARAINSAQSEGVLDIRIDMSGLQLLSSAGIGSILGAVEISREAGGDITIWNVPEKINTVLAALDLQEYLTIRSGEAEQQNA